MDIDYKEKKLRSLVNGCGTGNGITPLETSKENYKSCKRRRIFCWAEEWRMQHISAKEG